MDAAATGDGFTHITIVDPKNKHALSSDSKRGGFRNVTPGLPKELRDRVRDQTGEKKK